MARPVLDINPYLPPRLRDKPAARSVNLMAFLLHDVTYNQLYRYPFYHTGRKTDTGAIEECALERIIHNTKALPREFDIPASGSDSRFSAKGLLYSYFSKKPLEIIRDRLSKPGSPTIILGELFWKSKDASDPEKRFTPEEWDEVDYIVQSLSTTRGNQGGKLDHLCLPFVPFQTGLLPLIEKCDVCEFLRVLGDYTLAEFYTLSGNVTERAAVRRAKDLHILKEYFGDIHSKTKFGNGQWCVPNVGCCAAPDDDYWCNMTSGGLCALGSDSGSICMEEVGKSKKGFKAKKKTNAPKTKPKK